jgi:hypothetical protein
MKKFIGKKMGIILAFFILITSHAQTSQASDNLSLIGFVRYVDNTNGIIRVYVTSQGCKGLRDFKVPNYEKGDLDSSLIGRKLRFNINSATCEPRKAYSILLER